jgi:DNA modification methylase
MVKIHSVLGFEEDGLLKSKPKSQSSKTRANELDGKDWLRYSISVWDDIKKDREELKLNHPAMFPKELVRRLIQAFMSKEQRLILDPFLGSGTTLIAAKQLGKDGIGFDISKEYITLATKRLEEQGDLFELRTTQKVILDDAKNIKKYLKDESVDLVITSPPYWDILKQQRSVDSKQTRNYQEKKGNLGEITDYHRFINELKQIFRAVLDVLKSGSYCIIEVMDIRKKAKLYTLHIDTIRFMEELGFVFDDIVIWNRKAEYNNLKPIGFPYVFRINRVHEYILIFKKKRAHD